MSLSKGTFMPLTRRLSIAFGVVLAFDVLGALVAVAFGHESLADALVVGTSLNAPFAFVAVQALIVFVAVRARGIAVRVAAVILVLMSLASVVSGFEDGSYAAQLTVAERAIQVSLIAATAIMGIFAASVALRGRSSGDRAEVAGVS